MMSLAVVVISNSKGQRRFQFNSWGDGSLRHPEAREQRRVLLGVFNRLRKLFKHGQKQYIEMLSMRLGAMSDSMLH